MSYEDQIEIDMKILPFLVLDISQIKVTENTFEFRANNRYTKFMLP